MGKGRDISRVIKGRTFIVNTNGGTIGLVELSLVCLSVSWHPLPEIGSFKELQTCAVDIHRFEAVNETKDFRTVWPKKFTQFFDECQNRRPYHHVIDDFRFAWNVREIAGECCFSRRNSNLCNYLTTLCLDRLGEEVAMIMTKCKVRIDHCDLLAQVVGNKRCHRLNLAFYVCNTWLQSIAVQHATRDMVPF